MVTQHLFPASSCAFSVLLLAAPAFAQDVLTQPLMSEPYPAENAQTAMDEVKQRWDAAQQEQQARFSAFSGDHSDFVRSDPVLQNVTWPYETCTDLISLIPPPLEGWGVRSDAPFAENPIEDTRAEFGLVTYDADIPTNDPAFFGSEDSVSISLSASADNLIMWNMMYGEPAMRESMYVPGPYNYPVSSMDGSVLFGEVLVRISATDEADAQLYLEAIIGCAIAGGMIAEGIDVATLSDMP